MRERWYTKIRGWRAFEILLLAVAAVVGLPLALSDYDLIPPPAGRQARYVEVVRQIAALMPGETHIRSSHWLFETPDANPVDKMATARKQREETRRLVVSFQPPFSKANFTRWLFTSTASFDSVGRLRKLTLGNFTEKMIVEAQEELLKRDFDAALAELNSETLAWQTAARKSIQAAERKVALFGTATELTLVPQLGGNLDSGTRLEGHVVYADTKFLHVRYQASSSGEICLLNMTAAGPISYECKARQADKAEGNSSGELSDIGISGLLVFAAVLLVIVTFLFFAYNFMSRLIKDEWDLAASLRAGLVAALLVLIAWPWPLEIRMGLAGWPVMALLIFLFSAAALATFISTIREDNEEAAAPIEALVTRRILSREVLAAIAEGALAALALLGIVALVDFALFRAGFKHWPLLPQAEDYAGPLSLIPWLHELRSMALWLPGVLMVIWFHFKLHQWLQGIWPLIFGTLYGGLTLGAFMGTHGALSAVFAVGLGFILFSRRHSSGGLLSLISAALFWHLAPMALTAPPFGHGGLSGLFAALTFLTVFGLAIWGHFRAPPMAQAATYVPAYIGRSREKNRLQRELEIARGVQLRFLPERAPEIEGATIAFHCTPAMEVGGDYFDFLPRQGGLDLVVGDVSGKGVASAFYMTLAKGILHTLARLELAPEEIVRRLNVIFHDNSPQGVFLTLAYAHYDLGSREFTYLRAGHNACLIRRADGTVDKLMPPGMIIGFDSGVRFDKGLRGETTRLNAGDLVLLYTDGASEAMNARGDEFGDQRMSEVTAQCDGDAGDAIRKIEAAVLLFCDGEPQRDDLTLLVLKIDA